MEVEVLLVSVPDNRPGRSGQWCPSCSSTNSVEASLTPSLGQTIVHWGHGWRKSKVPSSVQRESPSASDPKVLPCMTLVGLRPQRLTLPRTQFAIVSSGAFRVTGAGTLVAHDFVRLSS